MKLRSVVATMAAFAIGSCQSAAQSPASSSETTTLHVRIYNLAKVPSRTLERALGETSHILAAAGIETVWNLSEANSSEGEGQTTDFTAISIPAQQSRDARDFLVVRFIRGFPHNSRPNALGYSLPAAHTGAHVTIFYDRTENVSLVVPPTVQKILGNALAHEIGHVLLGSEEHSEIGIMKAVWTRADYQRVAVRFLEFLPQEALAMRNEVSRRAALSSASPP
jgi:hypothetical protein